MRLPTASDVHEALERIRPHVVRTPLLSSEVLDARAGARLLIKPECLQTTGSFKLRGAFNRLLQMSELERRSGVVAWSAGNHGQALAYSGRKLGLSVTVVMPSDAPMTKIKGTSRWGANVVLYDRKTESREEIGRAIAQRTGAVIVPPFDDPDVIAGQGTACVEAIEDAYALGFCPDLVLCPTGGGGFIAGCALAAERFQSRGHTLQVCPVEPIGYDDTGRSLATGAPVTNDPAVPSICDALMTIRPGELTLAVNRGRLAPGLAVDDEEVREAMRVSLQELKLVTEPGGAVALAAALFRPDVVRGRTVLVVLSGGNVDMATIAETAGANSTQ